MKPAMIKLEGRKIRTLLILILLCWPIGVFAQDRESAGQQAALIDPQIEQKITLAEGFHDLAVLYIKKGDVEKAVAAARQIIQLRFPAEYEKAVAQSLSIITEKLSEIKRFDLGQALLDEALRVTEQNSNRVKIMRNKARLFMLAGDNDKAIETWRRALDLESRRSR